MTNKRILLVPQVQKEWFADPFFSCAMKQVADYVSSGRLVPDELAIDIVKQTLENEECKTKGWLLDNFPRTADQAMAMLDLRIIPSKYIHIEVPDHVLEERCMGRLTDPVTGHIYHSKFNPPPGLHNFPLAHPP
jgi:adenylate kinase